VFQKFPSKSTFVFAWREAGSVSPIPPRVQIYGPTSLLAYFFVLAILLIVLAFVALVVLTALVLIVLVPFVLLLLVPFVLFLLITLLVGLIWIVLIAPVLLLLAGLILLLLGSLIRLVRHILHSPWNTGGVHGRFAVEPSNVFLWVLVNMSKDCMWLRSKRPPVGR
jgi:hypothetical protein